MNTLTERWHRSMRADGLARGTRTERERVMRRFSESIDVLPECATTDHISDWFADNLERWQPSTRSSYYGHLKSFYTWLILMDHRDDDPMIRIKRPKVPRTEARPVPDEHMPRLLARVNRKRSRAMILLGALAGLRVSEIARVRGDDFDLLGGTLRVLGKGGIVTDVILHPLLIEMAIQMPRKGPWFPTHIGNRQGDAGSILGRSVSTIIGNNMRRAGVPGTPHSLRHWFGTTLVDDGTDMRTVQELLRHASLQTVQIYTKVSKAKKQAGVTRLDPWRINSARFEAA